MQQASRADRGGHRCATTRCIIVRCFRADSIGCNPAECIDCVTTHTLQPTSAVSMVGACGRSLLKGYAN
jgi:hypothetical protein